MKKKKNRLFKIIFWLFFLSFMLIYFSELTGYYEYKNYQKSIMTNEQIKQFEQDIKDGKEVNLDNYVVEKVNYKRRYICWRNWTSKSV